jgi:excisionase family DNA binding protein
MVALHIAAVTWRTSAVGTKQAPMPEVGPSSLWVGSAEAALALRITQRAVVLAISEGRLRAEKINGHWRISREDLIHFRIARSTT